MAIIVSVIFLWQGATSVLLGGGDSGWLIRTGEYIATNNHLPTSDLFTWTCPQKQFICYQWLFELIVFALFKMGGLSAVGAVSYALVSILYLYCLPRTWLSLGVRPALIPVFLVLVLTPFWFFARPQIATYGGAFLFIQILEIWRMATAADHKDQRAARLIYLLPPLIVLWTNLHCTAGLGILLIALYFLNFLLDWFRQSLPTAKTKDLRPCAQLLAVLLLALGALFITPLDLRTWLTSMHSILRTDMASCNELRPLFVTSYLWHLSNLYVVLATAILLIARRKIPRVGLLISLAALFGGLCVARLQPVGVILSWPFVGMALASVKPVGLKFKQDLLWISAALALALLIWFVRYPSEQSASQAFLGRPEALQSAVSHLTADDRVFNDTLTGSRLIYLKGPPVFIDSRLFLFDKRLYQDWLAAMNLAYSWPSFVRNFGVNSVVLAHGYPLYPELMNSPDWLLCVDDGGTSFWLKNDQKNCSRLSLWGIDPDRGETLGLSGDGLANHTICMAAKHFQTASAYLKQGKWQSAREQAEASQRLVKSKKVDELLAVINQHLIK